MRIAVYALTALAGVAILLAWLRLHVSSGGGTREVGRGVLRLHTFGGLLAVVVWLIFLIAPATNFLGSSIFGIVGVGLWWIVSLAGLLLIARWLPARGKHASASSHRGGLAAALVVHLGMLVIVGFFTWAYLSSSV